MQIVININDAAYGTCVDVNKYVKRNDIIFLEYLIDVIANGTPIPDNATNRDVLDKITAEIYEHFMTIDGQVHDKSAIKCMEIIGKYKGEKGGKE